jgi:hypothetical protein
MRAAPAVSLFLSILAGWVSPAQEAVLHGTIQDAVIGDLTACTVAITDANGHRVTESESFKSGFRCPGSFTKHLVPGRTKVRITRGPETVATTREFDLQAGKETRATFVLERQVDLRRRGWYAGDSHVHMLHGERTIPVDFDFVALTARAEDLQFLSLAQAWSLDVPTPEHLQAELQARSTPDCSLAWNLEAPKNYYRGDAGRCLGHCWTLGLRGRTPEGLDVIRLLLDASAWDYESHKPTYANFESHRLIHAQGGAVFYSHPARWWLGSWGGQGGYPKVEQMRVSNMAAELPLDVLAGPTFDGLDVITGTGEAAANARAFELWSLLLNHGYQLAATASSDACFDRPGGAVPGNPRTYTFVPGKFTVAKAKQAILSGRTFVTTGPLLLATLDGAPPGATLPPGHANHVLHIEAWAAGDSPDGLSRLEVLRNGQVFRGFDFEAKPASLSTNISIQETAPAWYCLRLHASGRPTQVALSGAFYFRDKNSRSPAPVAAQVRARIIDAASGRPLSGTLTEVAYFGTIPRNGKRHRLKSGSGVLPMPATLRLRAEASGYQPLTLSPFLDSPELVQAVTSLSDQDLLDWTKFERLRERLSHVELVFRLQQVLP